MLRRGLGLLVLMLCASLSWGQQDIAVVDIRIDTLCGGDQQIEALFKNEGSTTITSFVWNTEGARIGQPNQTLDTSMYLGSLSPGDSTWLVSGRISLQTGFSYFVDVEVDSLNGGIDTLPLNNNLIDTFLVNPFPTAAFSASATCVGDTLTLTGSGGISYSWSGPNSMVSSLNPVEIPLADTINQGIYELIVVDANFCADTLSKFVAVDSLPFVDLGPDTSICVGDQITIGQVLNSFHSYAWSNSETSPTILVDSAKTYTLTVTDLNACQRIDSIKVDTLSLPIVTIASMPALVCTNSPYTVLTIGQPTGGSYSSSLTSGDTLIPGAAGSYPITYTYSDAQGCTESVDTIIEVIAAPTMSFTAVPAVCFNGLEDTLVQQSPKGGSFFGSLGITDTSAGTYLPGLAGPGIDTVYYKYTAPSGCSDTVSQEIEVYDTLAISLNDTSFCVNEGTIPLEQPSQLYSGLFGNYSGSSALSGNSYNTLLYPSLSDTLLYQVIDTNSCTSSRQRVITIKTLPTVVLGDTLLCVDAPKFALGMGIPAGGTYFGNGVVNDSLDAALAGVGPDTIAYAYQQVSNGCSDTVWAVAYIKALPVVLLSLPDSNVERCIDADSLFLSGQFPIGGSFSGNGVSSGTDKFFANTAGVGEHEITYSFTDINACTNTALDTITVHDLPILSLNLGDSVCENAVPYTLSGGLPVGGIYTGTGVDSLGVFDASFLNAGDSASILYTYTDSNSCTNSILDTMVVDSLTPITLGLIQDYCINGGLDTLVEGLFNSGNFQYNARGMVNDSVYDPVLAGLGKDTVTYVFTNLKSCTDSISQQVEVFDTTAVSLNIPTSFQNVCENDAPFTLSFGIPAGGTYDTNVAIQSNQFDPTKAPLGVTTLIYTYQNSNNCITQTSGDIQVNPIPTVSVSADTFCVNSGSTQLMKGLPAGGKYSGKGMLNDTIYNPSIAGVGLGSITYTLTLDSSGCSNSSFTSFLVNPAPSSSMLALGAVCEDKATYALNAGASTGSLKYYLGNGVTDTALGTFDPLVAGVGSHVISYIGVNSFQCSDTAQQTLRVDSVPVVTLAPFNDICFGTSAFAISGGQPNLLGTGIYSGIGVKGSLYDPSVLGTGTDTIIYTFTDARGCFARDTQSITINPLPQMTAAAFPTLCHKSDSVTLSGALPAGGTYSGPFTDTSNNKFSPDSVGIWTIAYTYTDSNSCSNSVNQSLLVRALPFVSFTFQDRICKNANPVLMSGGVPIGSGGLYKGSGVRNKTYYPDSATVKTDSLWYVFTDGFGCTDSSLQVVTVDSITPLAKLTYDDICENGVNFDLAPYFQPMGGGFSGPGIFGSEVFPNLLQPDAYPFTYTFVNDNNCTSQILDTFYIRSQPALVLSNDTAICEGDIAYLEVSGALDYFWSNGEHGSDIQVSPDTSITYEVEGTNVYNCKSYASVDVRVNSNFSVSTNSIKSACGKSNGGGLVSVSRGTAPFVYNWPNGGQAKENRELPSGSYIVTVTDANRCVQYGSVAVSDSSGPAINLDSLSQISCFGDNNGFIAINIPAMSTMDVQWIHGPKSDTLQNLSAGVYTVVVKDTLGCASSASYEIKQADEILVNFFYEIPECDSTNGKIRAVPQGGVPSYTFDWLGQSTTIDSLENLGTGVYSVVVTDNNSCSDTFDLALSNPNSPEYRVDSILSAECAGSNGGVFLSQIDTIASFLWSNGSTNASSGAVGAGIVSVTATDTSGCKTVEIFDIPFADPDEVTLCFVTNSDDHGFNEVHWDTTGHRGVSSYSILRESPQVGNYYEIARINRNEDPTFVDSLFDAQRYSGNYGVVSNSSCVESLGFQRIVSHSSVLLVGTQIDETTIQLNWSPYKGINVDGYFVFKFSSSEGVQLVDSTLAEVRTWNDYNFDGEETEVYYFVVVRGQGICAPLGAVVSNYSEDFGSGVLPNVPELAESLSYRIYPNPTRGQVFVRFEQNFTDPVLIRIFDPSGKIIGEHSIVGISAGEVYSTNLLDISDGIYYLQVVGNGNVKTTKVVVNR